METSSNLWAAAMVDALLILSRSLRGKKAEGVLPDTLDVLLAGTSSAQGAAFVVAGDALDLVAGRGLTPGLQRVLQRLSLTGTPWFVAQRAARSRKLVLDRLIAWADRAVFAEARWEQMVACPVAAGGEVLGVIVIAWPDVEQPDRHVLATIEVACHLTALEMARLARVETRPAEATRSPDAVDRGAEARAGGPPAVAAVSPPPSELLLTGALELDERESYEPHSMRQEQLSTLSRQAADRLRREGPMRGAAVIAMLRGGGISGHEALAVLTFALSTGAIVRDPPPSTVLRASDASEPRRVLVVDDDRDLRQTLSEILNDEGYVVETATNGREALDVLRRSSAPRVVVLDMMMPVMDGWQLLEELRRDEALSRIPVIIISASSRIGLTVGATEILAKPLDYYKLVTSVERSVSSPVPPA